MSGNVFTAWRQALMALLDTSLQGGSFTVLAGRRDGRSRDRNLACVFVPKFTPDRNLNYARPPMIVRAWVKQSRQPSQEVPLDPEPVEQLTADLLELLQPVRTTLVPGLQFEVDAIAIDYEDWGVELTLAAWILNPGVHPPLS